MHYTSLSSFPGAEQIFPFFPAFQLQRMCLNDEIETRKTRIGTNLCPSAKAKPGMVPGQQAKAAPWPIACPCLTSKSVAS